MIEPPSEVNPLTSGYSTQETQAFNLHILVLALPYLLMMSKLGVYCHSVIEWLGKARTAYLQLNSPGFPTLKASERPAHDA